MGDDFEGDAVGFSRREPSTSVDAAAMKPDAPAEAKHAMRAEILRRREALGEEVRSSLSAGIVHKIRSLPAYRRSETVLAYSGFGSELDTGGFLRGVLDDGKVLVLPRILRDEKRLEIHKVVDLDRSLRPGVWGILEPGGYLPKIPIDDVDLVLVPGVAFDRKGGRLGHGGGFYDRLLGDARKRPELVAGAFEAQMVEEVPNKPHDVALDLIITESSSYPSGKRL